MSSFTAGKVSFSNTVLITHERAMPSGPVDTSKTLHLFQMLRVHTKLASYILSYLNPLVPFDQK